MLSERRARLLARRACAGSRRARRRLTAAIAGGDTVAADACLPAAWDGAWSVVYSAAVDPALAPETRAVIGAICTRHGALPENPVALVVFFVLTGAHDQYEAFDPDGTRLAFAYRAVAEATRTALREAMVAAGGLTLVRVVADRPDRTLTAEETGHLAAHLAEAGEWERLWRLLPGTPLVAAVRAARMVGDWQQPDDSGRELLARIQRTDPDELDRVGATPVARFETRRVRELSFAPDGSELACTGPYNTTVIRVADGTTIATHKGYQLTQVLALGGGAIVAQESMPDPTSDQRLFTIVHQAPDGARTTLLDGGMGEVTIGRRPGGFVVVAQGRGTWFGTVVDGLVALDEVPDPPVASHRVRRLVASDPVSGRFVLEERGRIVLAGPDGGRLAEGMLDIAVIDGTFAGPDLVITRGGDRRLTSWDVLEPGLLVPGAEAEARYSGPPRAMPGHDLVAVPEADGLGWFEQHTLRRAAPPAEFPAAGARSAEFSPDGTLAAVVTVDAVEVYDLALRALVTRPFADLPRARLREFGGSGHPGADLMRAAYEHRYGGDVSLGSAADGMRPDDIALGGA
jgi:hypothetical protein